MIRICACESQPIVVEGLRKSLEEADDLELIGFATNTKAVLDIVLNGTPKVCLIDKAFGT
jgi:DNA-binding NarL/FixJ family response regulator